MEKCAHHWEMENVQFGFVYFEKCFHCNELQTYFSMEDSAAVGEEYREGAHFRNVLEKAQSFTFSLKCDKCKQVETYTDMMGLLYCTECIADCEIDIMQKKLAAEKTWLIIAFGHLPQAIEEPMPDIKLDILTDYFNQRRDTKRSRIKIVPFNLIKSIPQCKGEFIHDVDMLSTEPPGDRRPIF